MAIIPELIYCADGNRKFANIAINEGYLYGAQLPGTVYFPIQFADQNWKKPNRQLYMEHIAKYRPDKATVLDLEHDNQLSEVLSWADEVSQFVNMIIIIPKVPNIIPKIPISINGKSVRLGYSVPTKYGKTEIDLQEFFGWANGIHLLGGAPHTQMKLVIDNPNLEVLSVDTNYHHKMAIKFMSFWVHGNAVNPGYHRWWSSLRDADGVGTWEYDGIYEAFRRSCVNIKTGWENITELPLEKRRAGRKPRL